VRRLLAALPQGKTLPESVWRTRHRCMLGVIWVQLAGLAVAGIWIGRGVGDVALILWPILACALAGALPTGGHRLRGSMVAFGALYCSAALVDFSGGATEAHFHFFVMVAMLAAYEEWVPYLLAVGFVVVHHGVVGVLYPRSVYADPRAVDAPWKWALIHAGFILALSAVSITSWRLNENARADGERAHDRTRISEAEFRGAFDDAPIGMAIVNLDGGFERVNRSLMELTELGGERLLRMQLADVVGEAALAPDDAGRDSTSSETPFQRADGTSGWGLLQRSIVRDERGEPAHLLVQLLDLTQRKEAERQLAHAADHDGLTGLPNRTCFERQAGRAIASLPAGGCVGLLFVDIDDFKSVNDSLGHAAGDSMLVLVAERLRGALAPDSLLARFGGDEFVILLARTTEREARALAERLLAALGRPCEIGGDRRVVTASVGLTMSDRSDVSAMDLIRDGDAAMYRAKASGKDGMAVFGDAPARDGFERPATAA
jgi:diguanylate cyclase (GGDEF)-like protein/PAS domain S-box-containing protein